MKKELLAAAIASALFTGAQALADHHNEKKPAKDGAKSEKMKCGAEMKKDGKCGGEAMPDDEAKKENSCSGEGGCGGE